jgi:hypothetical protein
MSHVFSRILKPAKNKVNGILVRTQGFRTKSYERYGNLNEPIGKILETADYGKSGWGFEVGGRLVGQVRLLGLVGNRSSDSLA